jgi:hypothetical protein
MKITSTLWRTTKNDIIESSDEKEEEEEEV